MEGNEEEGMKRSTPKDVENRMRGIIGGNKEPKAPRKPTKEENRADKNCSRETTAGPMDENDVVDAYPAELKRMNRGKV